MSLAPPARAPHVVSANRPAFTTPVREAGREGWITLHPSGDEEGEGTVHVYVGSGGYIEKGPKALCHQQIGQLASHPSVARTTRHPAGHEPPGARDHPDFHEAGPKPRAAQPAEGEEPTKRPGKPYARLHGGDQGTRAEQIGKALGEAQSAAKGAKAAAPAVTHDQAHVVRVMQAHAGKDAAEQDRYRDVMQRVVNGDTYAPKMPDGRPLTKASAAEALRRMKGEAPREAGAETGKAQPMAKVRPSKPTDKPWDYVSPAAQKRMDAAKTEQARQSAEQERRNLEGAAIHHAAHAHEAFTRDQAHAHAAHLDRLMSEHRQKYGEAANRDLHELVHVARSAGARYSGRRFGSEDVRREVDAARQRQKQTQGAKPEDKVADTAVAHQQAQAELAAHRAAHDRNPNPWAPHLSPPVGDARDRELQEKATRAHLAHQAAVGQQQGAQQAQQQEGQRRHEKEMVRLKHEQAIEQSARAAGASPSDARIPANQARAGHGLLRGSRPHNPEQPLVNPSHARTLELTPAERARTEAGRKPEPSPPQPLQAAPPRQGNLLRDQPSPSGKRRLEAPAAPAQRAPESRTYTSHQLSDMEPEQREAVAADKNTHPETLHELGLWNRTYARKVARNPSTRPETLHAMTQEMPYDPKMDAGIARHKNARPDTLHHLALHGDNPARALVAAHPNASEATRQHVLDGYPTGNILHGLARNPHTSAEHLEQVRRKSDDSKGVPTRQAIAEHQGAAEGTLHNLAHDYHPVATALAGRKAPLPEGVIETLARRKEPAVHSALLDRPDLPGRHVYRLARNGAPDVARKAQDVMDRRDAHARGGKRPVRESATPAPRFSAPVAAR